MGRRGLFSYLREGVYRWREERRLRREMRHLLSGCGAEIANPMVKLLQLLLQEACYGGQFDTIVFSCQPSMCDMVSMEFLQDGQEVDVDRVPRRILPDLMDAFEILGELSGGWKTREDELQVISGAEFTLDFGSCRGEVAMVKTVPHLEVLMKSINNFAQMIDRKEAAEAAGLDGGNRECSGSRDFADEFSRLQIPRKRLAVSITRCG